MPISVNDCEEHKLKPRQCGDCKCAMEFPAPDSGGSKGGGVRCSNQSMIAQHRNLLGHRPSTTEKSAILWRTELLDIECEYWERRDK